MTLKERLCKIKVIAMDVDGVLTDGRIIYDGVGRELKFFDVQDGFGIAKARQQGVVTAVISARGCPAVRARTRDLKIEHVFLDVYPKIGAYTKLLKLCDAVDEEVCFIGDDLPDLEILTRVGFSAAPRNAAPEIKKVADFVSMRNGGRGAVREIIEKILKAQGKWSVK